ncbi:MAG: transposase [Acidobacteria bacterium]|nr:transposase [Acidobacteriota bacterium]
MRRAKDNCQVPKRYYRPEQTTCPHCGQTLKRSYQLWQKHIVFLHSREWVVNMAYRCPNPECTEPERIYVSQAARCLTVRGSSFALEVIVQIGYWRFWKRWTVTQIHEVLTQERGLPVCVREVLNLIGVFLVLLRCTYHLRLKAHAASFRRHGLFVAIDALKPEKGNTALYVVRELKFGLVLHEVALLTADHRTLVTRLLQPVKDLGYRLRGIVSDDEKALVIALAKAFPGVPHQTCQIHCLRDAARPIADADRAFKKALKQAIRGPFYAVCRALQEQFALNDLRGEVLGTYADLIRSTLTEGSRPPFMLGGLRVFEDLARLEASLTRSRQKGGTPSSINCWLWSRFVRRLPHATDNLNANGASLWNWSGGSTHQKSRGSRTRPANKSSARSKNFWPSWSSTRKTIRQTRMWSPISARPSANVGRACLSVMPGLSATGPTMTWKPSLVGCGPGSVKSKAANPSMSLSSATVNGRCSLIPPNPMSKSCGAVSSLIKPSLIRSGHAFSKRSTGSKCSIVFATGLAAVSRIWNNNGPKRLALNLNHCLVC